MDDKARVLSDRFLRFAASVIKLCRKLNKDFIEKHVALQLVKAGTSCGANYGEGCGAESRTDFIHKLKIVLKELNESTFWLKLIVLAELLDANCVEPLTRESEELGKIIGRSLITAQSKDIKKR
jgi:four helix bundle protein